MRHSASMSYPYAAWKSKPSDLSILLQLRRQLQKQIDFDYLPNSKQRNVNATKGIFWFDTSGLNNMYNCTLMNMFNFQLNQTDIVNEVKL